MPAVPPSRGSTGHLIWPTVVRLATRPYDWFAVQSSSPWIRMPYKFNDSRRHKVPRAKYQVTNWPEYDAALAAGKYHDLVH